MESPLQQVILGEGAGLYRDICKGRAEWEKTLRKKDGGTCGRAEPGPSARRNRRPCPLHAYYPFLFHTFFQEVPITAVRELARADRLYTEHLLAYDRMLDRQGPTDTADLFLAQMEHLESLRLLHSLFAPGHPFWGYFSACYFEAWRSVREERLCHSHRIAAFSVGRFCALAKGKTALLRPPSMALAFLARRTGELPLLSASLDQHHIALVLVDDLEDWRQDFENANFTYLLTRLVRRTGLAEEILSGHPVPATQIGRLLATTGLMERQLRLAEIFFQKSNETVGSLPLPLWKEFNNGFRLRCRALRYDLAEIRRREEGRLAVRASRKRTRKKPFRSSPPDQKAKQIRSGIRFLADRQGRDGVFLLAASPHVYLCPRTFVSPSRSVTTLILRSLETVQSVDPTVDKLIRDAAHGLRTMKEPEGPSRLPERLERAFPCLPSDASRLALLDRSFAPGSGPMPDGIFWANFHCHCSRHAFQAPRLTAFVEHSLLLADYTPWSAGTAFGPVASPWTRYACKPLLPLLLLCRGLGRRPPGKKFHEDLLGPDRRREPWNNTTEVALILLCLLLTSYRGPALTQAVRKITALQEADGSWAPNAVFQEGDTYYGSRELTTAWCLEALVRYYSPESGPGLETLRTEKDSDAI